MPFSNSQRIPIPDDWTDNISEEHEISDGDPEEHFYDITEEETHSEMYLLFQKDV